MRLPQVPGLAACVYVLRCDAHLADEERVVSKSFQGRLGRAFLFEKAVNVFHGPVENVLISGIHKVADITCTVFLAAFLAGFTSGHRRIGRSTRKGGSFLRNPPHKEGNSF